MKMHTFPSIIIISPFFFCLYADVTSNTPHPPLLGGRDGIGKGDMKIKQFFRAKISPANFYEGKKTSMKNQLIRGETEHRWSV